MKKNKELLDSWVLIVNRYYIKSRQNALSGKGRNVWNCQIVRTEFFPLLCTVWPFFLVLLTLPNNWCCLLCSTVIYFWWESFASQWISAFFKFHCHFLKNRPLNPAAHKVKKKKSFIFFQVFKFLLPYFVLFYFSSK